jgi:preprotein translocase subunit SecG
MYYLISALILLASGLLVLAILVQNSKGGGLAANFAGSNQAMGVRRTTDFLEKATWTLACSLLALCLAATMFMHGGSPAEQESALREQLGTAQSPGELPAEE